MFSLCLFYNNSQSELSPQAWQQYSFFDTSKPYTRNLIATDNKTYTLMLLCWNPGQESPIHSHPCDGCWLQVLDGQIREVRYDTELQPFSDETYTAGQLSWITDNIGYHKVGNASPPKSTTTTATTIDLDVKSSSSSTSSSLPSGRPAATLHLYSPPFKECHFWRDESDPTAEPSVGKNIHYSEYGFLCSQDAIP
jgi:cysteine dioxygenase